MLRALVLDPEFPATVGQLVKQPVEWVVGAVRQLGIDAGKLDDQQLKQLSATMRALGQVPFRPPSVAGRFGLADHLVDPGPAAQRAESGDAGPGCRHDPGEGR